MINDAFKKTFKKGFFGGIVCGVIGAIAFLMS